MANNCNYSMKIVGPHEKVAEFIKWIKADYNYSFDLNEPKCSERHHFYRVFSAYDNWESDTEAYVYGDCAWSVATCFTERGYYEDERSRFGHKCKGITLSRATRKLGIKCEIYSSEPGCCFAEHYIFDKGRKRVDQTSDYSEFYLGDYDTKDEAEAEYGGVITDEQWENEDYIISCQWDTCNEEWHI